MSEDELKTVLSQNLSSKSRERPEYWNNADRNNPSQPVVGITWFEANAYCAWLSAITERKYGLPSEVEWEAAMRGSISNTHRQAQGAGVYPWGHDFDATKANTIEGRVLKPSPVGAYTAAGNIGTFGIEDGSGNVWNWTSSIYSPYPYNREDGREDENAEGERIARGGSWFGSSWYARCAYRYRGVPDDFNYNIGFRVLSPVS